MHRKVFHFKFGLKHLILVLNVCFSSLSLLLAFDQSDLHIVLAFRLILLQCDRLYNCWVLDVLNR